MGLTLKRKPYFVTDKNLDIFPEYLESGKLYCITLKVRRSKINER